MKKKMKAFLAAMAAVFATVLPCHAHDGATDYSLVVYTADGQRTAYALNDHPRLTISGTTFTITTASAKADYAAADLLRFTIETGDETVEKAWWLVVSLKDGTIEGHPFADLPKITINASLFTVTSASRTVGYAATAIDRFRLTDSNDGHQPPGGPAGADVNGDGVTDVADIAAIISVMAQGDKIVEQVAAADVNGDEVVDVADIATVITAMASSARMTVSHE